MKSDIIEYSPENFKTTQEFAEVNVAEESSWATENIPIQVVAVKSEYCQFEYASEKEDIDGNLDDTHAFDNESLLTESNSLEIKTEEDHCLNSVDIEIFDNAIAGCSKQTEQTEQTIHTNKTRNERSLKNLHKTYLDYMSEDEAKDFQLYSSSDGSSDSTNSSDAEECDDKPKIKKKKLQNASVADAKVGEQKRKEKKINKRKQRSILRQMGKEFKSQKGRLVEQKILKPNPCTVSKGCSHKCYEIPETKREALFNYFYSIDSKGKRDWICGMTQVCDIKRKRVKNSTKKDKTYAYFINEGEGRRRVCLKFILDTLVVSQKFVHYTLINSEHGMARDDARGKCVPSNKTKPDIYQGVIDFIKLLPAVPSRYCRKDSSKLYLPKEMKNIPNLHDKYKIEQRRNGKKFVGEKLFRKIFTTEFNLSFHVPKTDKCAKCDAFKDLESNEMQKDQEEHKKDQEAALKRFLWHQSVRTKDPTTLFTSFVLQKVINTPMSDSMLLFYSRKYAVFNLCLYESVTRLAYCYTWGESEGQRGANEIATAIVKYIHQVDEREVAKKLLFYSDSCPSLNRNKVLLAAVHLALLDCNNISTIQVNYLIPGHSNMPVDSVPATIENSVRTAQIWAPSQWPTVFELARKMPFPYNVESLQHTDFLDYATVADKYFDSNLRGQITKIRTATFKKSEPNKVFVKHSMNNDEAVHEIIVLGANEKKPTQLYTSPIPLSKEKYNDLINLCKNNVIPRRYHSEYMSFPSDDCIQDTLIDTDIEDSDYEER